MTEFHAPPLPDNVTRPHRGVVTTAFAAIGVLGALALVVPAWLLGGSFGITFAVLGGLMVVFDVGALLMAIHDRPRIQAGEIDPAGERWNRIALGAAIAGLVIHAGFVVLHFFQIKM
ncbi:MAG: hypothetical protein ACLFV7_07880 [Phycisphaerae bacterium]